MDYTFDFWLLLLVVDFLPKPNLTKISSFLFTMFDF